VSILDLNGDLNLAIDAAAPIDLGVAANANVAAPIDGAVAANANVGSIDSSATAVAQRTRSSTRITGSAEATPTRTPTSLDGERDIAEVARAASSTSGRTMTAANVETLLEKLRPMGLVVGADGAEPSGHRTNPLLALRMKVAVTDPQRTRALTAPFARLFHPIVVVAVVAPFGWICWWVLVERGLVRGADPHHRRGRPRSSNIPGGVPPGSPTEAVTGSGRPAPSEGATLTPATAVPTDTSSSAPTTGPSAPTTEPSSLSLTSPSAADSSGAATAAPDTGGTASTQNPSTASSPTAGPSSAATP
jgi:nitrate reductase NapE component